MSKIVYQTDKVTGEYLGVVECRPNPLEDGKYLIPAGCVEVQPQPPSANHVQVWNGDSWTEVEDHRGATVYLDGGYNTAIITELGPLPANASTTEPSLTATDIRLARILEIDARLGEIDIESARPLRAVVSQASTQADTDKLVALENEAVSLRAERATLATA